jgi:hypothetical protein
MQELPFNGGQGLGMGMIKNVLFSLIEVAMQAIEIPLRRSLCKKYIFAIARRRHKSSQKSVDGLISEGFTASLKY